MWGVWKEKGRGRGDHEEGGEVGVWKERGRGRGDHEGGES